MPTRRLAVVAAVAAVTALGAGAAHAHQASATFARIETTDDPTRLRYEIRIAARDLFEALRLDSDREATAEEIRAGGQRIAAYVSERIGFEADGVGCPTELVAVEPFEQGQGFARV